MQENDQKKLPLLLKKIQQQREQPSQPSHSAHRLLITFLIILGGVIGIYFQLYGFKLLLPFFNIDSGKGVKNSIIISNKIKRKTVNGKYSTHGQYITGLGTIIPNSELLSIAAPFGASGAKISDIFVKIGQKVKENQLLAVLDNRTLLQAAVEAAKSELAIKEATLKQTMSDISWQLDEAKAELKKLKAKTKKAQQDYVRAKILHKQEVISTSELEEKESLKLQHEHELNESRARLKKFTEDIENQVDVIVAHKNIENAKMQLKLKEAELKTSEIISPINGTIIDINARKGEIPPAQGVFYMGDLSQMRVNVDIYQTQISKVKLGAKVKIISDSLPQNLQGKVIEKGLLVERQNRVYDSPTAQTDSRVVEIVVVLDDQSSKLASSFSNLQVIAHIYVNDKDNL